MINNVIVEGDVYEESFVCQIESCKGICCIEGDFGAPLEESELAEMDAIHGKIDAYLEPESVEFLRKNGPTQYFAENSSIGTPVHDDGRCAYAVYNQDGSIGCGIEHAWLDKKIAFRKPVSCHLYPIRIKKHPTNGMEMMTYERWNICSAACSNGKKLGVSLLEFAKDAVVRKYGSEFVEQLEEAADTMKKAKE